MTLPIVDTDGRATIAAAEAQAALMTGDTPLAQERYAEAGRILEGKIAAAGSQANKHLFRFLAASQYYHGGHYQKALKLCHQIKQGLLPEQVRPLFPQFARDVKERTRADYGSSIRQHLLRALTHKDYGAVITILQQHPYVLDPGRLSFLRADACENLGNYQAAALFFADAMRRKPEDSGFVLASVSLLLTLPAANKLEIAWEYAQYQLQALAHPVTEAVTSIICSHKLARASSEERMRLMEAVLGHLNRARAGFSRLSPRLQQDTDLRDIMALALEAVGLALGRFGDRDQGVALCDAAIAFQPRLGSVRTTRGMIRYPAPDSLEDFRKAIELGDSTYGPRYYLAHHAITTGNFQEGLLWARQALQKAPLSSLRIRAQLQGWTAICQAHLGTEREAVQTMFEEALAIDPQNADVQRNYRLFRNSPNGANDLQFSIWEPTPESSSKSLLEVFDNPEQLSKLPQQFGEKKSVQHKLQEAGV
jgi:tetratricopeptide (TPR) repeat protein